MSKGRSSGVVGIRLPDEIIAGIRSYLKDGQTVASWVKDLVISSVNTTDSGGKMALQSQTPSVNTTKPKITELQKMIRDIETKAVAPQSGSIPIYDSRLHKVGDTVKKWNGVRYVVTTVPEVDADGHEIHN